MKRSEIEKKWVENSYDTGAMLCSFFYHNHSQLEKVFSKTYRGCHGLISSYPFFDNELNSTDTPDVSYLLRALTLNMLLDDNPELLEKE